MRCQHSRMSCPASHLRPPPWSNVRVWSSLASQPGSPITMPSEGKHFPNLWTCSRDQVTSGNSAIMTITVDQSESVDLNDLAVCQFCSYSLVCTRYQNCVRHDMRYHLRYDTAFLAILIPQLQTSTTCRCH